MSSAFYTNTEHLSDIAHMITDQVKGGGWQHLELTDEKEIPEAVLDASGIWYAFKPYARPSEVKKSRHW